MCLLLRHQPLRLGDVRSGRKLLVLGDNLGQDRAELQCLFDGEDDPPPRLSLVQLEYLDKLALVVPLELNEDGLLLSTGRVF